MKAGAGAIQSAVATVPAPFGSVQVHAAPEGLVAVDLRIEPCLPQSQPTSALLREAVRQLSAYFRNSAFEFSLPLHLDGTAFQRRVWERLLAIPRGATCTYGSLAASLDSGPRAIAAACRDNPLPLIIPCHRVVGVRDAGGYFGQTTGPWLEVKQWLLRHERQHANFGH